MMEATYFDLLKVVGEDCNEPKVMYQALGFSDFYEVRRTQFGPTPVSPCPLPKWQEVHSCSPRMLLCA